MTNQLITYRLPIDYSLISLMSLISLISRMPVWKTVRETQNKRGSVAVIVTALPLVKLAAASLHARHAHSHARTLTCFAFFPVPQRETARSLHGITQVALVRFLN